MNPRQASLLDQAKELGDKLAAKKPAAAKPTGNFYEYIDSDGNHFYLPVKRTQVRSPFTGENLTGQKPTAIKPGQMAGEAKELKEEAKSKKATSDPFWKS